jgi:PPOX class probable F420-dependent enzyme
MAGLTPEARTALSAGHLAHLVTLGPDGAPQITVIWVGVEGDEIVAAHFGHYQKVRNIERNPRVALSMVTGGVNEHGLDNYLVVHGTAHVTEGGAPEMLRKISLAYMPPGVDFPIPPNAPPGYITHVTVDRVGGIGPWSRGDG